MNALDPIKKVYKLYSDKKTSPYIVEVLDNESDLGSDPRNGPADPYLEL